MPNWLGKLKLAAYALGLLAVAHPAIVPPTLATLGFWPELSSPSWAGSWHTWRSR